MDLKKLKRFRKLMLIVPVAAGLLLISIAYFYYLNEKQRAINESYKDLNSIGQLKATQIASWFNERSKDAAFYSTSEVLLTEIDEYNKTGQLNRNNLLALFKQTMSGNVYEEILITDKDGKLIFSIDPDYSITYVTSRALFETIQKGIVNPLNLYYCPSHKTVHNDIMAPLTVNGLISGVLIMRIDPNEFLYPYIQQWPVPSETAETMLTTRVGDSAVILNQMKKIPDLAFKYKVPLSNSKVPQAAVVNGKRGMFSGIDYTGDKVLSDLRRIDSTPWYLVVKIDQSEINDEVIYRTTMFGFLIVLVTAFISGAMVIGYRRRQEIFLRIREKDDMERFSGELKRLVEERTAELQRTNEDLLSFSHIISHDLKEPVRKIKIFISLLKTTWGRMNEKDLMKYLERVDLSANRLKEMIDAIYKYTEIQNTHLEVSHIDLNICMEKIREDLEMLIETKDAELIISQMPRVDGVNILLYKVFYNLVENALKYSRPGVPPKIVVSSDTLELDGKKYAKITVSDNGIGFENEYKDKIFENFKKLHPKDDYEGVGLGLALCKKIVERHKGSITASGIINRGATFTVILPMREF